MAAAGPPRRPWFETAGSTRPVASTLPPAVRVYINAAYYPNWRVYRNQPPSSLKLGVLSHVFYAFVKPNADGSLAFTDEYADTKIEVDGTQGGLRAFGALKKAKDCAHLKVLVSIGGGGEGSAHFAAIARDGAVRMRFANAARAFVDEYGFDGLDIDWEHPSDPRQGADYVQLLTLLRRVLPAPRYLLTSALPAGEWALRNVNLAAAAAQLDLINLMAYDFSGPWTPLAGHHAQLHAPPASGGPQQQQQVSGRIAVDYLAAQGVPPAKILLGVPAYGRSFLGASARGQAHRGHGGEDGTFEYRDLPRPGTDERVDGACCAAFCVGGDGGFVTYDSPATVREKARYAKERGLGGLFYWTATGDAEQVERSLVYNGYMELHTPPELPR